METLMLQPISLTAFFLDGNAVIISLAAAAASIYLYILIAKKLKYGREKGRMLEKTGISRGIGIVSALFFTAVMMSWTGEKTDRKFIASADEEAVWGIEDVEIINIKKEIPKTVVQPPKLESPKFEIKDIIEKLQTDKTSSEGTPDGTGDPKNITKGTGGQLPVLDILPPRKEETEIELPVTFAEKMPRYCGCEEAGNTEESRRICSDKKMTAYLAKIVDYPVMARDMGYEGKVFVSFTVEKDGSISNIEVKKDLTPGGGLANAAKKAVEKMAKDACWQAGEQKGRKVKVRLTVPVQFKINPN